MNVNAFFEKEDILHNIMKEISKAKKNIYIMHFWFTYKPNIDLLVKKQYEGVDIKILVDIRTHLNYLEDDKKQYKIRAAKYMIDNGLSLRVFNGKMLHHKDIIIDDRIAICGSCNLYKESLFNHNEDIIVIKDETINTHFQNQFFKLYKNSMNKVEILHNISKAYLNSTKRKLKNKIISKIRQMLKV